MQLPTPTPKPVRSATTVPTATPTAAAAAVTVTTTITSTSAATATAATARVTASANIRSGPGTTYAVVGSARAGDALPITGKDAASAWWRITYRGREAWIFARLVRASNAAAVPVATAPAAAPAAAATRAAPVVSGAAAPSARFDPQQTPLRLETVFTGLGQPTYVTHAGDGSNRLFVLERAGRILVYAPGQAEGEVFLDINDRVGDSGFEQGLLGLAFPPDYAASGVFYINYTDNNGDTVIARYHVSGDPNRANRESEAQLLWVDQPAPNHNGGMLVFGPDGKLWAGLGNGGDANDTFGNGQKPEAVLGSLLRLTVSPASTDIQADIWAKGLRNPWRFSFDRRTGDLWIGDVGQDLFEEVNFVPAAQVGAGGFNFGWPVLEGAHCRGDAACDAAAYTAPILEYGHAGNGCSITGGYVYRGAAFPQLNGVYLYADFCSGHLWAYWRTPAGQARNELVIPNAAAISSFGEDEAGELYVTDFGGAVHRIVVAGQ